MAQSNRRLAAAITLGFIADYVFNIFYHGCFMMQTYTETADLWRNDVEMQSLMGYYFLGNLIMVTVAGIIFSRGFENKGLIEGARFGLLIGLLMCGLTVASFSYLPITPKVLSGWILGNLAEGLVIGLSFASIYGMKWGAERKTAAEKKAAKPARKAKKK